MQEDYSNLIDDATEAGLSAYEAAKELGEANVRALQRLFEVQLDAVNLVVDGSVKQVELLGEAKGYQELLVEQSSLAKEYGGKLFRNAQQAVEVLADAQTALKGWAEESLDVAAANLPWGAPKKAA